jgi:signal transduction histidine kinase/CheY-like chemotaxis protein
MEMSVPVGARVAYLFDKPSARFRFVPFIASGLLENDKCVIITDRRVAPAFRDELAMLGVDPDYYEREGGLLFLTEEFAIESIEPTARAILEDARVRFRFMRCLNDPSWMTTVGWTPRDFFRLEVKGHLTTQQQPCTVICQYDETLLDRNQMERVLEAHNYRVVGSRVEQNPDRRPLGQIIFDGLDEQLRTVTHLQELSLKLPGSVGLQNTLEAVLSAALAICRADCGTISCFNEAGELRVMRSHGLSEGYFTHRKMNRYELPIAKVVSTRRTLVVEDVEELKGLSANYSAWKSQEVRSIVTVPLVSEGEVYGVIGAGSRSSRRYTQTEIEAMAILAAQAGAAITTARLFEQLGDANRAKDEFLATLSHELRTPLTPILGWINMLKRCSLSDPLLSQGLDTIERNARQQAELINDLLDVTRIISGKIELVRELIDLPELVRTSVNQIRPQAEGRLILVDLALPDGPVPSFVDSVRIQQVLANLLTNAVKFTPEGGRVGVTLICESDLAGNGWAVIEVSDSGIGIEPEFLQRIFERFTQADGGLNRRYGGLGLGLAISRALVDLHGGEILAGSGGLGQGSRFTVRIPTNYTPAELYSTNAASLAGTEALSRELSLSKEGDHGTRMILSSPVSAEPLGLRILIVEDSRDTLEMLKLWLDYYGCQVDTANTAGEGLRIAGDRCPDLIISDIGMPELDGYELIRRLRKTSGLEGVPAIALTGYARNEDRDLAFAAGYNAHVAKPADLGQLVDLIRKLAGGKQAGTL